MEEEELEELKRRKMLELQQRMQEEQVKAQQRAQIEAQRRSVLMEILEPKARSRLANIKVAKPEYAVQIENLLIQLAQSGQIRQKITDAQLKAILAKIMEKRRDVTIRRI